MTATRGEARFVTDGKESVVSLAEYTERLAKTYARLRGWDEHETSAVKISRARWGGMYNVAVEVSKVEPVDGRGAE